MLHHSILARIQGRVQGVGFRYHTQIKARELGLCGWVKNLPDGTVESYLHGELVHIQAMQDWLADGPDEARVTTITYSTADLADLPHDFSIR